MFVSLQTQQTEAPEARHPFQCKCSGQVKTLRSYDDIIIGKRIFLIKRICKKFLHPTVVSIYIQLLFFGLWWNCSAVRSSFSFLIFPSLYEGKNLHLGKNFRNHTFSTGVHDLIARASVFRKSYSTVFHVVCLSN